MVLRDVSSVNIYVILNASCLQMILLYNYLSWCIEEDLRVLSDWFRANSLTLNEEKSVTMTFHPKKFTGDNKPNVIPNKFAGCNKNTPNQSVFAGTNIKVNNVCLPDITHTKFLGVWLDTSLTWNQHLSKLYVKLKRNLNLLKVGKNLMTTHTKKNVYYAPIYSHISYGIILWGNMIRVCDINTLQKIQNKCFKLCTGLENNAQNFYSNKML